MPIDTAERQATEVSVAVHVLNDWPTYAQMGRQLLQEQKVAALLGCWTSVSRKSVLPVAEQNDGLLFYPLHFEGEENSKNVVYVNSPPSSSVLPAVDYRMGAEGGNARRFFMLGSDYVWPRTINKILKACWAGKGIEASAWREEYVPFGFSNFQNLVNQIRSFTSAGGEQPIVVLTVVGNLNCWAYLQDAPGPRNQKWLADWAAYVKKTGAPYRPDVAIDPMVSTYDSVHMWALAAKKAGSFDVTAVRAAFPGLSFDDPSGYTLTMNSENNYVGRGPGCPHH